VALGLFAMAARNVTDPDVWWHLRTGQLITQTRAFLHTDPFSFTRHGEPWVNHEWLSDVLLYGLYRAVGWGGLIVVFGAITSLTLMLVFVRCPGKPYFAALALTLGAYAAAPGWGVRPHTISLLLASIFLLVLDRSEENTRLIWWTVPLTLLWVNLHAEFALGIALLALFFLGESVEAILGAANRSQSRARLRYLGMALAACIAVIPLNPNGLRMYTYPIETLRSSAMQKYIAEWASPNFHEARYVPFAIMLLGILFLLSVSSRRVRPRDLLVLLVVTAGALRSVRHISVFVLVGVPILSALAQSWWHENVRRAQAVSTRSISRLVVNGLVLAAFLVFAVVRIETVVVHQPQSERANFPAGTVEFLNSQRQPGPIFNHYNFGGYFIWKLYPEYAVFIDGRADLYGDEFLHNFAKTYYVSDQNWEAPIRDWKIRTVVLPPDAPVVAALKLTHAWDEAYRDSQAVVLTRNLP
jgi:hypothetical protein